MSLSPAEFRARLAAALPNSRNFACRLTENPGEAEDLMQATAVRALEMEPLYVHIGRFSGWLNTVMFRAHLNRQRIARIRVHDNVDDHPEAFIAESSQEVTLLLKRVLTWADVGLSENQREAVSMYVMGNSEDEMAEAMDCAPGTVKSRLSRAREALHRQFGEV